MADEIRVSELTGASDIGNNDLVLVSQVDALSASGYSSKKATMTELGNKVNNSIQYGADLITTNKTIIGAINEVGTIPDTASGAIATFTTSLAKPLVSCEVDQNATTVTRCGKNLIDTTKVNDGYISGTGSIIQPSATSQQKYTNYFPCSEGDTFTLTTIFDEAHEPWIGFAFYDSTKTFISRDATTGTTGTEEIKTVTIPSGVSYFIATYRTYGSTNIWLETGSDSTSFEAYNGTDYPVADIDTITTLQGVNNIFADSGDISVTYLETIKEYIDKAVSNV